MKRYVADLHVHTLLSPCAAVEMTPRNIVQHAQAYDIDIVAITDHNAGDNVRAAIRAAAGTGVTILPGMEVESSEEVHVLALFESIEQFEMWEDYVKRMTDSRRNDEEKFGAQFIVDEEDNFVAAKPEMLLSALKADLAAITAKISALGGIAIASHVDRPAYSILSQLGFIPPDVHLTAAEVTRRTAVREAALKYPAIGSLPVISFSDAHNINDFINGAKTLLYMEHVSLQEIVLALNGENLRKAVVVKSWG